MLTIAAIETKLKYALHMKGVRVSDDSALHRGHLAYKDGLVTHIKVSVPRSKFRGRTALQIHRLVYDALRDEIKRGLHSISIEVK